MVVGWCDGSNGGLHGQQGCFEENRMMIQSLVPSSFTSLLLPFALDGSGTEVVCWFWSTVRRGVQIVLNEILDFGFV